MFGAFCGDQSMIAVIKNAATVHRRLLGHLLDFRNKEGCIPIAERAWQQQKERIMIFCIVLNWINWKSELPRAFCTRYKWKEMDFEISEASQPCHPSFVLQFFAFVFHVRMQNMTCIYHFFNITQAMCYASNHTCFEVACHILHAIEIQQAILKCFCNCFYLISSFAQMQNKINRV